MALPPRAAVSALAALAITAATVGAIELTNSTLDGGGGISQNAGLRLAGTIGQPDAGIATAGTLSLQGGFWAGATETATPVEDGPPGLINEMGAPAPNPFNPRTTIRFQIATAGPTTVRVYDSAGRRVRTLVEESLPAGRHDFEWNGRDDRGQSVASGTYHVQLRSGNYAAVRKVSLVK